MVKVDSRGRKEIIAAIKERARSFTPEWNPNEHEPDIAVALALASAEMFEGTIKKINGLPLKNQIAFYNMLNASLLPASPSRGYVSFSLSADDAAPVEVPLGTVVSSYSDDEPVNFETTDDVLVSAAQIVKSFCVDDKSDFIGIYDDPAHTRTKLFSLSGQNLQSHVLRASHPYAFHVNSEADIKLSFFRRGGVPLRSADVKALTNSSAAVIEYYTKEKGYIPFEAVRERGGNLLLTKGAKQPPVITDEDGFQIRITVKDISAFKNFKFVSVKAAPSGVQILPDYITDGVTELERTAFFPFGERFQLFDEAYFGCDEVLDKRGATVTMNFDLQFLSVPIENQLLDDEINWKWVAKKSDFKERISYELSIREVIWEYYNGFGWARLFPDRSYYDVFNYSNGVTHCYRSMTFVCPEDISPVFAGAKEGYFIRARILKAENLYKLKGNFLSPFIRDLSFDYSYENDGCGIDGITSSNCLEEKTYDRRMDEEFVPFYNTGTKNRMVYLGFNTPPENGPLRCLWDIKEDPLAKGAELGWQYLSGSSWKALNMVDETNRFTTVGLTIFLDNHGFVKKTLFGEELYWVRISDKSNSYRDGSAAFPVIKSITPNTVRAKNTDSHREEYFAMNVYTENAVFSLSSGNILDIEVYVNEFLTISDAESARLEKEGRLISVTDEAGIRTEAWVKWEEAGTFVDADKTSRCYIVDRSAGAVSFGNGRKGRIPAASDTNNIHVFYTTGGGNRSNAGIGEINSMERSIGLVSTVTNPKHFYGGCDTETIYEAVKRSAVMFKTQGKAVTASDLENLARYASRNVENVKAFGGRNMAGEPERGVVTLVVLKSHHSEFSRIREELRSYLLPRIAGSIACKDALQITEPTFVYLNIKLELAADGLNGLFELKRSVENCLRDSIRAYSSSSDSRGWALGRLPKEHRIRTTILRIEHISYIKSMYITTYLADAGGMKEVDSDAIRRLPYILPECGEIDISIVQA